MQNFEYFTPTKVYFGKGICEKIGEVLKNRGCKKILLAYGGGSIKKNGLYDTVTDSLSRSGLVYYEIFGIEPNPKLTKVYEGIDIVKKNNIDFLLAVGGGSVIDTCKSIALAVANDEDPWKIILAGKPKEKAMPVGTVPTIAAAGSEMSNSHVISNAAEKDKRGLNCDAIRPAVSFLDPVNTFTVSKYQTACGIVDIMMHTFERYFTPDKDDELTDRIAEGLLISVKEAGTVAYNNPTDYEARATLLWAASLSHNGLTGCGRNAGWATHKIEQDVSGVFDHVAHGAGLAVLFPAYCKYMMKYDLQRFVRIAVRLWGCEMDFENPEKTAIAGIQKMEEYFHSLGMPLTLGELGIGPDSYMEMARHTTRNGTFTVQSYIPIHEKEICEIFKLAQGEIPANS